MGIFKPGTSSTVYAQEFSWLRSPEVWGVLAKVLAAGFVAGFVVCVWLGASDVIKDATEAPCKAPTSQTPEPKQQP